MIRELCPNKQFRWLDLSHPTPEELQQVQDEFNLHPAHIQDCLDPVHLPKIEKIGNVNFTIIRIFDIESEIDADTIQSLTRKVAIFVGPNFIITVHRFDAAKFSLLADRCLLDAEEANATNGSLIPTVIVRFVNRALRTFHLFLEISENKLDSFEAALFEDQGGSVVSQDVHIVRRQLSLTKRILIHTQDVIHQLTPNRESLSYHYQDLKDTLSTLIFLSDELLEDTTNLLSIQLSLASQKTNEVVRVLTVFSVFFMPLTFIVGVYGMNFKHMPELEWEYGYHLAWAIMICVTIAIGLWFYKRGWLQGLRR
jgi:magnesium transporter